MKIKQRKKGEKCQVHDRAEHDTRRLKGRNLMMIKSKEYSDISHRYLYSKDVTLRSQSHTSNPAKHHQTGSMRMPNRVAQDHTIVS